MYKKRLTSDMIRSYLYGLLYQSLEEAGKEGKESQMFAERLRNKPEGTQPFQMGIGIGIGIGIRIGIGIGIGIG